MLVERPVLDSVPEESWRRAASSKYPQWEAEEGREEAKLGRGRAKREEDRDWEGGGDSNSYCH